MGLISLMFVAAAANAMQNQQQQWNQQQMPPPPEPVLPQQRRQTAPPQPPRLRTFLARQFVEGFREGYNLNSGAAAGQPQYTSPSTSSAYTSPQSYTNPYISPQ